MTVWLILRFDNVLVSQYSQLFSAQNKISAKVYDALSNIVTVIILRVEKPVLRAIAKRIRQPLELFKKNSRINEMKWFLVTMCATLMIFFIPGSYLYINLMASGFPAGRIDPSWKPTNYYGAPHNSRRRDPETGWRRPGHRTRACSTSSTKRNAR